MLAGYDVIPVSSTHVSLFDVAEEKRKQEFFKARGLLKEQKEGS